MRETVAFSSLGLTVGLVVWRPRLRNGYRVGPAIAALTGVAVMAVLGIVHARDAGTAAQVLWRPLLAISSIMIIAACALRLGVINRVSASIFPHAQGSPTRLFLLVFALSAGTAAVLNNDSAVLLVTPLVVLGIRSLYPRRPKLVVPFAFAVFMAAGVAPLVTANPMNLIVADYAGLDFNAYALRMLPISLAGWLLTGLILRRLFRAELAAAIGERARRPDPPGPWAPPEWQGLGLVLIVLGAYPLISYVGGSVWTVAGSGALIALLLCLAHGRGSPREVLARGVSWEILLFLFGIFVLAIGLRNVGLVGQLTDLYGHTGAWVIGGVSAVGSGLMNNHSMALTNLLALRGYHGVSQHHFLAALIGGDLGPRLLPMGSLAGLLWFASLRRLNVEISLRQFVAIGVTVTLPALALSLALLELTR
jgi:arsenical pump membrane protein